MPVKIFFCYAREDEELLNKLKIHLRPLQRNGLIDVWHDREITAGAEWENEIRKHLDEAQVILLLVSPSFINSEYCYSIELKRALERHERNEANVIPIILDYVYWQFEPLNKLQALPTDAKPIMGMGWHNQNEALLDVTEGIRKIAEQLTVPAIIQPLIEVKSSGSQTYPNGLTAREVEILSLLADGLTAAQIGEQLVISPRTVNTHLTSIYRKIGVDSRIAAVRYALDHGLIDVGKYDIPRKLDRRIR